MWQWKRWWGFTKHGPTPPPPIPTPTPPPPFIVVAGPYRVGLSIASDPTCTGIVVEADPITVGIISVINGDTWVTNAEIPATIDYPFAFSWTYKGYNASAWTQVIWTVKTNPSDADSAAVLAIKITNPGSGSDGLIAQNGTPPVSPVVKGDGVLTVTTGTNAVGQPYVTITVAINARGMEVAAIEDAFWGLAIYLSGVKQAPLDGGRFYLSQGLWGTVGQT